MITAAQSHSVLLREADKWLLAEHISSNTLARQVLAARRSGFGFCPDLAVAWLKRITQTRTRRALWAAAVLRELSDNGQIRGTK